MEKVFHTILMALDFIAAVPYICKGDVKMTVYWIAAGYESAALAQAARILVRTVREHKGHTWISKEKGRAGRPSQQH